jgi:hypothetical protein
MLFRFRSGNGCLVLDLRLCLVLRRDGLSLDRLIVGWLKVHIPDDNFADIHRIRAIFSGEGFIEL